MNNIDNFAKKTLHSEHFIYDLCRQKAKYLLSDMNYNTSKLNSSQLP